uniref:Uncharacterized protein n=1 Tax=Anguilla anguilla TaxID=7936 RepID=A0A0E9RY70_ANGAN
MEAKKLLQVNIWFQKEAPSSKLKRTPPRTFKCRLNIYMTVWYHTGTCLSTSNSEIYSK